MRDFNKNTESPLGWEEQKEVNVEPLECNRVVRYKKNLRLKKNYTVTITYIQLTDEEAKIKRAILEGILKKGYKK